MIPSTSSTVDSRMAQLELEEKASEERTRAKSVPETVSDNLSQDQSTDSKKAKSIVLDAGEDMTDGGKQRRRRGSQKDGRSGSLKVHTTPTCTQVVLTHYYIICII